MVLYSAKQKHIMLTCALSDQVPECIPSDATRVRQVLLNLLANAVKFTDQGEVCLAVDVREMHHRAALEFSVRDTGIGIPESKREVFFESFVQIDETCTRRHGGSGLGLAISKRIAERMGGDLTFESVLGQGSTFHFRIP